MDGKDNSGSFGSRFRYGIKLVEETIFRSTPVSVGFPVSLTYHTLVAEIELAWVLLEASEADIIDAETKLEICHIKQ